MIDRGSRPMRKAMHRPYVVTAACAARPMAPDAPSVRAARRGRSWWYPGAVLLVVLATLATVALRSWMGSGVSLLFFPAIVIAAMYGGYGPAFVATGAATLSLTFFFVEPYYSLDIGVADDVLRLAVFIAIAVGTAALSSARRLAEDEQRRSVTQLDAAVSTMRKVSGWPVLVGSSLDEGVRRVLQHASAVMGAPTAVAVWELEDEPWVYVAASGDAAGRVARFPPQQLTPIVPETLHAATLWCPSDLGDHAVVTVSRDGSPSSWIGVPAHPELAPRLTGGGFASARFDVEHLNGRVFFAGVPPTT